MQKLTVLIPEDGQTPDAFANVVLKQSGKILIILPPVEDAWMHPDKQLKAFLKALKSKATDIDIAMRNKAAIAIARNKGFRVVQQAPDLRKILHNHEKQAEALIAFSPHLWRQQLRSNLQKLGLLSMPKLRIWLLVGVSIVLFWFVLFRLLPSAEITVVPREETITQTANIFLVNTGSTVDIPQRVRTMELVPVVAKVRKTITFDQISREFIGNSSRVPMTVMNKSDENYSLRKGSRLSNQAGIVFRIEEGISIDPNEEVTVMAIADDLDLFGEIIGERGNVPANLEWDFPGLTDKEQDLVYAENRTPATGGTTVYRNIVLDSDLKLAENTLKDQLLTEASNLIDEQLVLLNAGDEDIRQTRLYYDELTSIAFTGFVLPTQFLGRNEMSIPVEGGIEYTAYAYDANYILTLLRSELHAHVSDGYTLLEDTVHLERLVTHVIDYSDDLSWIKLTVDLSGTERAVLDPLTPNGARFAKNVRNLVLDTSKEEAIRILRNLPEVEKIDVSLWPPWSTHLPSIPYHITISTEE